jgi:hypothetical protein
MTTRPTPPATPGTQAVFRHLAAIEASLSGHGVTSRLTRLGGTPVLTIEGSGSGEDCATITVDPDTHAGPGLRLECTCIWTPAPDASPQATAAIITAVLDALRPIPERPWTRAPCPAAAAAATR